MIILSFYLWDVGVGGSCVVGVLVVDSFELCSVLHKLYHSSSESLQ